MIKRLAKKESGRAALFPPLDWISLRSSRFVRALLSPDMPSWACWAVGLFVTAVMSCLEMILLGIMVEGALLPPVAAVVIAALVGGRGPGLVALALNLVIAEYIVIPPYYTFVLPWPDGVISMAMFTLVASIAWYAAVLCRDELAAVRERDELMATAAHDLRNPLHTLNLCLLQMQVVTKSGDQLNQEKINEIHAVTDKQLARMAALIEGLLGASRTLATERTQFDLAELVRNVASEMAPEFESKQGQLVLDLTQTVGIWNPIALRRVIVNLLTNALKYAPGSSIRIDLTQHHNFAILEISDSGPGIDPSTLPRILQRYQRGRTVGGPEGIGLGLYIVRQIVEAHGGRVSVHSMPGEGTRFAVTLPLGAVPKIGAARSLEKSKPSAWA